MSSFVVRFWRVLERGERTRIVIAVILSVILAVLDAVGIGLLLPVARALATTGTESSLNLPGLSRIDPTVAATIVVGIFTTRTVAALLYVRWNVGFLLRAETRVAGNLFLRYMEKPYSTLVRWRTSDVQRNLQESLTRIFEEGGVGLVTAAADALLIGAVAVILIAVEPFVAVVASVYFAAVAAAHQLLVHRRLSRAAEGVHAAIPEGYRVISESLQAVREIKLRHAAGVLRHQFETSRRDLSDYKRSLLVLIHLPRYLLEASLIVGVTAATVLLLRSRPQPEALAIITILLVGSLRLLPSLNRLLIGVNALRTAAVFLDELYDDLITPAPDPSDTDVPVSLRFYNLAANRVSFRYADDESWVFEDLHLTVQHGTMTGIAGRSGTGKSTLLDLVLGLLRPDTGSIEVNGVDVQDLLGSWQRAVGYVPQQTVLLNATIAENVAFSFAAGDIDAERLRQALVVAGLAEFVDSLPRKARTPVGENGVRLSGGQRQRLGLARALYHQPAVLVLDEATSALDGPTETDVLGRLQALLRDGTTIIMVTHRPESLRQCSHIYLLGERCVLASGTYDQLVESSPLFRSLTTSGGAGAQ